MKNRLRSTTLLVLLLLSQAAWAQGRNVEMADALRANGKIYVVVAILGIIFAGLVVYLIFIDRKISRLEREIKK